MNKQWFYLSLEGRISRRQYALGMVLVSIILGAIAQIIDRAIFHDKVMTSVVGLVLFWPGIATSAKRLHDLDKSGWWQLLYIIPIVGFIFGLYLIFKKGDEASNRFGPPPLPDFVI